MRRRRRPGARYGADFTPQSPADLEALTGALRRLSGDDGSQVGGSGPKSDPGPYALKEGADPTPGPAASRTRGSSTGLGGARAGCKGRPGDVPGPDP